MRLGLYQPDIPQNAGTILRLAACMGVGVDVIGPAGFDLSQKAFRRAGMDYIAHAQLSIHQSWQTYSASDSRSRGRLVLLTTAAKTPYTDFDFSPTDTLLLGRESSGVPPEVHAAADARVTIPMQPELRSLNIAVAAAMVLGEALRQTGGFAVRHAATD